MRGALPPAYPPKRIKSANKRQTRQVKIKILPIRIKVLKFHKGVETDG
jgi:hypothetical protein